MRYQDVYEMKKHTWEECLALIESGDIIAVSGGHGAHRLSGPF